MILRLPQVIGKSNNNLTLINYFVNSINNYHNIYLQKNATRYFIEIQDLVLIVEKISNNENNFNKIHNIAIPIKYTILEIINTLEKILRKKAKFEFVEGGINYTLDIIAIENILQNVGIVYDRTYLEKSLFKVLE
jgi:nucleoside-diphosphate-sugar epimerase